MSLFDFLFPEQAQASHLRGLLRHQQMDAVRERHDRRAVSGEKLEEADRRISDLERRVDHLVDQLAESEMVTRALVEMILQSSDYTSDDLKDLIEDIDARDGVVDGRITPEGKRPRPKFVAKRSWMDQRS